MRRRGVTVTLEDFLGDRQGRTFTDVVHDADCPFAEVLKFFSDAERQQRMEESEIHHDRAPLAGVVREFEAYPSFHRFLGELHARRTNRFRQAVGVVVRLIMELRGWRKTGRKGSLGVRASTADSRPDHNTGGLAFWFIRAERYELGEGMPYRAVRDLCRELETGRQRKSSAKRRGAQSRKKPRPSTGPRQPGVKRKRKTK